MGLMLTTGANAAPEVVPVEVTFVAPITIVTGTNLHFGLLDVSMAFNDTVTIAPNSSVTDPQSNVISPGTQTAASLTITSTGSQGLTITADTPIDGTWWSLGSFICNYDSGSDLACDSGYNVTAPVGGVATLLVGAVLTGAGGASAGPDNGSFEVTVIYQ